MSQNSKWSAWQSLNVKTPEIKNIEINKIVEPVIIIKPKVEEVVEDPILPTETEELTILPKQTNKKYGVKG
jgi:hypothetical protein